MSPETRKTEAKINYWDFIRIKSFYTGKETIKKIKYIKFNTLKISNLKMSKDRGTWVT